MENSLTELSENFRKGLMSRRVFIQRVTLATGSVMAATHALSTMGFDAGLIQEAKEEAPSIQEMKGQYPSGDAMVEYQKDKKMKAQNNKAVLREWLDHNEDDVYIAVNEERCGPMPATVFLD